jgi:hypothetical protein
MGAATQIRPRSSAPQQDRYTGVVIIHGLGDIKRSETLTEAINSLAYWYNHHANLALRRDGTSRVWVTTHLTDDPNPEAKTARATMELAPESGAPMRLEFREVWWAGSFGLPAVGAAIRWTQVQFSEQAANLRSLFDRSPDRKGGYEPPPGSSSDDAALAKARGAGELGPVRRGLLRGALPLYDVLQYAWKAAQWTCMTPLVFLMLAAIGPLKLLKFIPGIGPSIVSGLSTLLDYIMLHWIAEAQVYALDYSRSAGIRARFEHEIQPFLTDDQCERIVVIAHSMGTVIAYEGLTSVLPEDGAGQLPKPVTFICLAQALRRIWLMTPDDPHRLREVLHRDVRWLHFWARYDPVTAGPLTPESLPRLKPVRDLDASDTYGKLALRIGNCKNVAVVNTDSTFSDHSTYWQNLEQVVGPIARELVDGHEPLANLAQARLARTDDYLRRRWRVAWRATLSLVVGFGVGISVLVWGAEHRELGRMLTNDLAQINWGGIVNAACPPCSAIPIASIPQNPNIQQVESFATNNAGAAMVYLFQNYLTADVFVLIALALLLMGLSMSLVSALAAEPSPFQFQTREAAEPPRVSALFALSAIGVALVFLASIALSNDVRYGLKSSALPNSVIANTYIWALGIAEVFFWIAYIATALSMLVRRQIGWLVCVVLGVIVVGANDPLFNTALLALAVAGCALRAYDAFRVRQGWGLGVALALVALLAAYAGVGTTLDKAGILRTPLLGAGVGVEFLAPMLVYAIWLDIAPQSANKPDMSATRRAALALAPIYITLLALLAFPLIIFGREYFSGSLSLANLFQPADEMSLTLTGVDVAAILLIGATMLALAFADAALARRWSWVVGIPALLAGLFIVLGGLLQLGASSSFAEWGAGLSFVIVTPALIYAVWSNSQGA